MHTELDYCNSLAMWRNWRTLSLTPKLFIAQSLILVFMTLGVTVVVLSAFETALESRAESQLESVRALKRLKIDNVLDNLKVTAQASVESAYSRSPLHPDFDEALKALPIHYDWVKILELNSSDEFPPDSSCPSAGFTDRVVFVCDVVQKSGSNERPDGLYIWVVVQRPLRVALLVRLTEIEEILKTRDGMGETGETYIVDSDYSMRTPSRFPEVIPGTVYVKTASAARALNGEVDQIVTQDYRGVTVYSAFSPIEEVGLHWALITELDVEEALSPERLSRKKLYPALGISLVIAFSLSLLSSITLVRRAREAEQRSWLEGQEAERSRLAQELHDGIGQLLTWQSLSVSGMDLPENPKKEILNRITNTLNELRRIVQDLTPLAVRDLGWRKSIAYLCDEHQRVTGVQVTLEIADELKVWSLSSFEQLQLFRMVQECLNNSAKHSFASKVMIRFSSEKGRLRFSVQDNGKGFPDGILSATHPARQLRSLSQRVDVLGGKLRFGNAPSGGARLDFELPMEAG